MLYRCKPKWYLSKELIASGEACNREDVEMLDFIQGDSVWTELCRTGRVTTGIKGLTSVMVRWKQAPDVFEELSQSLCTSFSLMVNEDLEQHHNLHQDPDSPVHHSLRYPTALKAAKCWVPEGFGSSLHFGRAIPKVWDATSTEASCSRVHRSARNCCCDKRHRRRCVPNAVGVLWFFL